MVVITSPLSTFLTVLGRVDPAMLTVKRFS